MSDPMTTETATMFLRQRDEAIIELGRVENDLGSEIQRRTSAEAWRDRYREERNQLRAALEHIEAHGTGEAVRIARAALSAASPRSDHRTEHHDG